MLVRTGLVIVALLLAVAASGCGEERASPVALAPSKGAVATATELPSATDVPTATDAPAATETAFPIREPPMVAVPLAGPAVLNGTLSPGEWDGAAVERFADGSELLLMAAEGSLYLGVRASGPEMIVANVFVDRGGEVAILHASAAPGTALYEGGEGRWRKTKDFAWCCRSTGSSATAQAEGDAFWAEEGWLAANSRTGTPNELEYRISWAGGMLRLAVSFLRESETMTKIPWPADLDDDVVMPTPGGLPAELELWPERWGRLAMP